MKKLESMETGEIMHLYGSLLNALSERGVVRTRNSPVGDYAEWLVSQRMGLHLEQNSQKGYDATDSMTGTRYQIKSRWEHGEVSAQGRLLNVIRNYEAVQFDYLIILIFDDEFRVKEAYQVPHELIGQYGRYSKHQNGYLITAHGAWLHDSRVHNITNLFI